MPLRVRTSRAAAAIATVVALALGMTACSGDDPAGTIDLPAQVAGDFPQDTQAELEAAVTTAMSATGSSGAIVGVWAPWSGSWVAGLGTVTPDGAAVTTDMAFKAGRITRAMTCDVLYRVAAEGTVDLDDSVAEWVGGVASLSDVTLKELCDSTSGIGSYSGTLLSAWLNNPERTWNPEELAAFGLGASTISNPGSSYRDSDAGYLLLGLALERATGKSAADLIQQYVTGPLGLESTYLEGGVPSSSDNLINGLRSTRVKDKWSCSELRDLTDLSGSAGFTNAGVVSTVSDLGRYVQALAAGTLMPEGSDRFADLKPVNASAPSWSTYGGGAFQAGSLVGSFGSLPGYITGAFADGETGLTVVVVMNNSAANGSMGAWLAWELAAIASKAPAAEGGEIPAAGLPWTANKYKKQIVDNAICKTS